MSNPPPFWSDNDRPTASTSGSASMSAEPNLTRMVSTALERMDSVLHMNTLLFVNQMRIDAEIQRLNAEKRRVAENARARCVKDVRMSLIAEFTIRSFRKEIGGLRCGVTSRMGRPHT